MTIDIVYLSLGLVLMLAALARPFIERGPLTAAMLYLAIGGLLSPPALGLLPLDPIEQAGLLERISELAVVVSLFVCGLKLQASWRDPIWRLPLRLAFVSMAISVALVTLVAYYLLGWPLGVCVILGAVLAPTDPVLASDVQVEGAHDKDQLRFSITGEGSFNDGAAFPFLYLGLGLLGAHHLGPWWASWWLKDVLWGVLGGLAIGAVLGALAGRMLVGLDKGSAQGLSEFLAFGLVFTSYGLALALGTHAFLAAFTSGLALRWAEGKASQHEREAMAPDVLGFKERVERLLEALTVVLIGALVFSQPWSPSVWWFVPLLFLILRPIAVLLGLLGSRQVQPGSTPYLCWFGIRGVGSVYYLTYAIEHGLPEMYGLQLSQLVYPLLGFSILVHGLSVSPLMERYGQTREASGQKPSLAPSAS